jgi:hypothetical protein
MVVTVAGSPTAPAFAAAGAIAAAAFSWGSILMMPVAAALVMSGAPDKMDSVILSSLRSLSGAELSRAQQHRHGLMPGRLNYLDCRVWKKKLT